MCLHLKINQFGWSHNTTAIECMPVVDGGKACPADKIHFMILYSISWTVDQIQGCQNQCTKHTGYIKSPHIKLLIAWYISCACFGFIFKVLCIEITSMNFSSTYISCACLCFISKVLCIEITSMNLSNTYSRFTLQR